MSLSVFKTVLDRLSPQFAMDQSDWLSRLEGRRYAFPAKVVLLINKIPCTQCSGVKIYVSSLSKLNFQSRWWPFVVKSLLRDEFVLSSSCF